MPSYWESFRVNKTPAPTSLIGIHLEPATSHGGTVARGVPPAEKEGAFIQPGTQPKVTVSLL